LPVVEQGTAKPVGGRPDFIASGLKTVFIEKR
jgi:hypothetical protein